MGWGSSVSATVVAYNAYGNSLNSTQGNGAVIITNPDSPLSLAENVATRGPTQIGITWSQGASNGGTSVIDYQVWITTGSNPYTLVASGVTLTQYVTTSLTTGVIYTFIV